jgi:hypothetical protein
MDPHHPCPKPIAFGDVTRGNMKSQKSL